MHPRTIHYTIIIARFRGKKYPLCLQKPGHKRSYCIPVILNSKVLEAWSWLPTEVDTSDVKTQWPENEPLDYLMSPRILPL